MNEVCTIIFLGGKESKEEKKQKERRIQTRAETST